VIGRLHRIYIWLAIELYIFACPGDNTSSRHHGYPNYFHDTITNMKSYTTQKAPGHPNQYTKTPCSHYPVSIV
jgi:hypothetical protein